MTEAETGVMQLGARHGEDRGIHQKLGREVEKRSPPRPAEASLVLSSEEPTRNAED